MHNVGSMMSHTFTGTILKLKDTDVQVEGQSERSISIPRTSDV